MDTSSDGGAGLAESSTSTSTGAGTGTTTGTSTGKSTSTGTGATTWSPARERHVWPGTQRTVADHAAEYAAQLEAGDERIYTVAHTARRPRHGSVLVCGSFGVERERSYSTLVSWARRLAVRGFDVLRFDYCGTGESSGPFEGLTVASCRADAARCAAELALDVGKGVLVVHGVRFGALVAAELFGSGIGDALLVWAPPKSARDFLRDTLRHQLIAERALGERGLPRLRDELVAALEAGEEVVVDGYTWTRELWREAATHAYQRPGSNEKRPWCEFAVGTSVSESADDAHTSVTRPGGVDMRATQRRAAVDSDTFWASSSKLLVPRSDHLSDASLEWLDACVDSRARYT